MVHPQTITQLFTDNTTASVISKDTIKQQISRAINMQHVWIREQKQLKNFPIAWKSVQENNSDYFTKHHSANHHKRVRPIYI